MPRFVLTMFAAAFMATPNNSIAQLAELLTPVTGPELADVRAKNEYYLKKHLYSARHHRIVTADIDLFRSGEPFVISLFDGDALTFDPSSIEVSYIGRTIRWNGEIANPPISANELLGTIGSTREATFMYEALFGVSIWAGRWRHDTESGANFPYYSSFRQTTGGDQSQGMFYGLRANILIPGTFKRYSLQLLEMGGAYHIIIEIDKSKVASHGLPDDPEVARRHKERREFMESLGEDPRRAILRGEQPQ